MPPAIARHAAMFMYSGTRAALFYVACLPDARVMLLVLAQRCQSARAMLLTFCSAACCVSAPAARRDGAALSAERAQRRLVARFLAALSVRGCQ